MGDPADVAFMTNSKMMKWLKIMQLPTNTHQKMDGQTRKNSTNKLSGSIGRVPIQPKHLSRFIKLNTTGPSYQSCQFHSIQCFGSLEPTLHGGAYPSWISRTNWFFISLKLSFPGYPHLHQNAIDSHRWTWWRRPTETWKELRCNASPSIPRG